MKNVVDSNEIYIKGWNESCQFLSTTVIRDEVERFLLYFVYKKYNFEKRIISKKNFKSCVVANSIVEL